MTLLFAFLLLGADGEASTDYRQQLKTYYEAELSSDDLYPVIGQEIELGPMKIALEEGIFFPTEKVDGVVIGGLFQGKASFHYEPTDPREKQQLVNQTDIWTKPAESLEIEIERLFVRGTDTITDLIVESETAADATSSIPDKQAWKRMGKIANRYRSLQGLRYLEKKHSPDSYGEEVMLIFEADPYGHMMLRRSGWERREIQLTMVDANRQPDMRVLAEYDLPGEHPDPAVVYSAAEEKKVIDISHYQMLLSVPKDLEFETNVTARFQVTVDNLRALTFQLIGDKNDYAPAPLQPAEQTILGIHLIDGDKQLPIEYAHYNNQLFMMLPKSLGRGETHEIRFDFRSKNVIERGLEFVTLLNTYPWFPQYGYMDRYTFDWTVGVDGPLVPVTSGKTVKRWKENGYNWVHSVETVPSCLASIIIGKYISKIDDSQRPAIHVFTSREESKKQQEIINITRGVIDYFEQLYGPFPYEQLNLAQMFEGIGFGHRLL